MTHTELERLFDLIAIGESESVEFKESFGDEALQTIGAFANAYGGVIFIGIEDSGKICGLKIGKKTLEDIANRIQENTDPRLQPSISIIKHEKESIVVVKVSPVTGIPVSVRGRYFRRTGRTNQRMSHEEIMQRMVSSTGLSWDAFVEPSTTIEDLDADEINRFVNTIKRKGRLPIPEQATSQDVLRKLELVKNDVPTRAALLLFGKNPGSYFPSAFLKLGRFRSPTHIVDDREIHGTLMAQLDGAMNWFKERLITEFVITGDPEREVHWEYPLEAIREGVVNVLAHRDYTSLAHGQIRLYDDRLEIWNPGNLPAGLTAEALLYEHDSIPRNRKIADAFFYAGFIERWGSGTLRMAEALELASLPSPRFESKSGNFRLYFYKNFQDTMDLSEKQLKAIAYVKEHGSISNIQYQTITGDSKRTASRELNKLREIGVFVLEGTTGPGNAV